MDCVTYIFMKEDNIVSFKVGRDRMCVVSSVICIVLFVGVIVVFGRQDDLRVGFYLMCVLVSVSLLFALYFAPWKLCVDNDNLTIYRSFDRKLISLDDISVIKRQELTMGDMRVFGCGGLFGYTGWYGNRRDGRYFCYLGSRDNTVMLVLRDGKKYMLSCDEPDLLVDRISSGIR